MRELFKNTNLLKTFDCAARHQSYSKAANELCISQAAVSQQMRQLEAELGTKAFIRVGKQMNLTPQGQILFEATQQAFNILNKGLQQIKTESISGSLTICSTQAFATLWLMPRLERFATLHPDIKIKIISSPKFDDLKQHHIDLAIRFGPSVLENNQENYTCEYFGEDNVLPICSAKLAESNAFNQPSDLLNTWLVGLSQPGPFDWQSWFKHQGLNLAKDHPYWTEVQSTDMAINAVINGHGITLSVPYLCASHLDSGKLVVPINIPHPNIVKRYLMFDPNSLKIERLKIFMTWLKKEMETNN